MIITQIVNIDIVDEILIRPEALNCYLGQEVNEFLINKLTSIQEPTLINIDLRKANPIDYSFTKEAFGTFFKKITIEESLDAVFYLNKSQIRSLYWGLLESQEQILNGAGDYENDFKSINSIKISVEKENIIFVSNLNEIELKILDYVNKGNIVVDKDLYQHFTNASISYDDVTDSIRSLKVKKFIYKDETTSEKQFISIAYKRDNL